MTTNTNLPDCPMLPVLPHDIYACTNPAKCASFMDDADAQVLLVDWFLYECASDGINVLEEIYDDDDTPTGEFVAGELIDRSVMLDMLGIMGVSLVTSNSNPAGVAFARECGVDA